MTRPATSPKVSVLLPVYNQEGLLPSTLDSILAQDHPNLIVCASDDGSTDGSPDILKEYHARYPGRFRLSLLNQNVGVTANCNAALRLCDGDYVAILAGDDLMYPGKVSRQVKLMEADPECVLCYHDVDVVSYPEGEVLRTCSEQVPPREGGIEVLLKGFCFFASTSILVRRTAIPESGYNEWLPDASDWSFLVDCLRNGGTLRHLGGVWGAYRRHAGNLTETRDPVRMARCYFDAAMGLGIAMGRYPERTHDLGAQGLVARNAFLATFREQVGSGSGHDTPGFQPSPYLEHGSPDAGSTEGASAPFSELEKARLRGQRLRKELDRAKESNLRLRHKLKTNGKPSRFRSFLARLFRRSAG